MDNHSNKRRGKSAKIETESKRRDKKLINAEIQKYCADINALQSGHFNRNHHKTNSNTKIDIASTSNQNNLNFGKSSKFSKQPTNSGKSEKTRKTKFRKNDTLNYVLSECLHETVKNSLHHLHDHLIATLPTDMSMYYQKLHDTLLETECVSDVKPSSNKQAKNDQKINSAVSVSSSSSTTTAISNTISSPSTIQPNTASIILNSVPEKMYRDRQPQVQSNEMHEFINSRMFMSNFGIEDDDINSAFLNGDQHLVNNPYAPPPNFDRSHPNFPMGGFFQNPINTLNRVTDLVRSPTSHIYNSASYAFNLLSNSNFPTFARKPGVAERVYHSKNQGNVSNEMDPVPHPPPMLPEIACSMPQRRLSPLTLEEFESNDNNWTKESLCCHIFTSGIENNNELRLRLWPIILGLCDDNKDNNGSSINWKQYQFDWSEKEKLFEHYKNQWMSILPDQEKRFALYRERKTLIERDVIRSDRFHEFYAGESENLEKLSCLLLTYNMYDFDTGYVQGMSDLASPLLYVAGGDECKAFWFFVQVMSSTYHNFEMSQSAIKLQLTMLWKLIELTDPVFAQYLANQDSVNCYFAFRWILCLFKREFMKNLTDDYHDVLLVWESIWTCGSMRKHFNELKAKQRENSDTKCEQSKKNKQKSDDELKIKNKNDQNQSVTNEASSFQMLASSYSMKELSAAVEVAEDIIENILDNDKSNSKSDIDNQPDKNEDNDDNKDDNNNDDDNKSTTNNNKDENDTANTLQDYYNNITSKRLTDTELYILCICLSIIRSERDFIMTKQYDLCAILEHFNKLQLNSNLKNFLHHASNIWCWLVFDGNEELLYQWISDDIDVGRGTATSSTMNECATASNNVDHCNGDNGGDRNTTNDFDLLIDLSICN